MKRRLWIVFAAAVAAVLFLIVGLLILPSEKNQYAPGQPMNVISNPMQVYEDAVCNAASASDYSLTATRSKLTISGQNLYKEQSNIRTDVSGWGTESLQAFHEETITYGQQITQYTETFTDGNVYVRIGDGLFRSEISADDYAKRLLPQQIIDPQLYTSVVGFASNEETRIIFEQSLAPEAWAIPENTQFIDGKAVVRIDAEGKLIESLYTATYKASGATVHIAVSTQGQQAAAPVIPEDISQAVYLDHPDSLKLLEQASGYLIQASNIHATYRERIYCQAFGDQRTQESIIEITSLPTWSARVNTEVISTNTGHVGEISKHTHNEQFTDGKYSLSIDGREPESNDTIDHTAMEKYCQNLLLSAIILPEHITAAHRTEQDSTVRIQYSASEAFARSIAANCCQTLYEKPELLDQLTENYQTSTVECYLDVDPATGVPTGAGILYEGIYTIDAIPYQLQFQADQTFE